MTAVDHHVPDHPRELESDRLGGLTASQTDVRRSGKSGAKLTTFEDDEYIYRALQCGASGFQPRSRDAAIRPAVAAGGELIDRITSRRLIGR